MFMLDDSANSFIGGSQVLIHFRGSCLMQLRDFKDGIESPGHWGFFAGHIEAEKHPSKPSGEKSKKNCAGNQKAFDIWENSLLVTEIQIFYCVEDK